MRAAVIADAVRTPIGRGRASGALARVHPADLLAGTIRALVERSRLDPAQGLKRAKSRRNTAILAVSRTGSLPVGISAGWKSP